jgi:hypothetical protein
MKSKNMYFYGIRTRGQALDQNLLNGPGLRGYGNQILSHNLVMQFPNLLHGIFEISEYRR